MEELQSEHFIKKMQGLYLEGFEKKINNLSRLFIQCKRNPSDIEVISELFRETHTLVGSGGSFGFPLVSQSAEIIRESLRMVKDGGSSVDEGLLSDLVEFIGTLQTILEWGKKNHPQRMEDLPWLAKKVGRRAEHSMVMARVESGTEWKVFIISSGTGKGAFIQNALIKSGIDVRMARDTVGVMTELRDFNPDVIIIDMLDSAISEREMCEVIRLEKNFDRIPILIITDRGDDFRLGQTDLCKVVSVLPRVVGINDLLSKVGAYLAHSKVFRSLTHHDPVTGLYNYRYFYECFMGILQTSKQHHLSMAVALVKVTQFELINESHGFIQGDTLLRLTARFFLENLRHSDIITRYSGGKLGIIMPDTRPSDALRVLKRLKKQGMDHLSAQSIFHENGYTPSFIAGIAGYPDNGEQVESIVKKAEIALQEAEINNEIVLTSLR